MLQHCEVITYQATSFIRTTFKGHLKKKSRAEKVTLFCKAQKE